MSIGYSLAVASGAFDIEALSGERVESPSDQVVFLDAVSGNLVVLAGRAAGSECVVTNIVLRGRVYWLSSQTPPGLPVLAVSRKQFL
jgi:hypothetical protein